ncbi:MAG: DUF6578 domain-containing protein [Nocardioides sp.]
MLVFVEGWQMECCGPAFEVGDHVEWMARRPSEEWLAAVLDPGLARRIEHAEEHHHRELSEVYPLRGRVRAIQAAYGRYAESPPGSRMLYPVPGSATLVEVSRADGSQRDTESLDFNGFLVELDPDDSSA